MSRILVTSSAGVLAASLIATLDDMEIQDIESQSIRLICRNNELDGLTVRDIYGDRPHRSKSKHQRRKAKGYFK